MHHPTRIQHETKLRQLTVHRVQDISPRMRRIVLGGPALQGFVTAGADDHVKLFFSPTVARDYTPRRFDPEAGELTLEFVMHGDGPAAAWAAQAAPGQMLGVGGPRGSFVVPDDYALYVLAGDETALPSIARRLEELRPGARAMALIEVADAAEERHLPTAANVTITWLHRNGAAPGGPDLLYQALRALQPPPQDAFAWVAGEIGMARLLRRYLIDELGFARPLVRASGYWRHGVAAAHTKLDDEP